MAQTKKSVGEFIQDTFCPMVAVLCSYDAESSCRKNNLTFAELIQPFCRLPSEVAYRDPSNNLITLRNLRLEIRDFNSLPPQSTLAKKLLYDAVGTTLTSNNSGAASGERSIDTEQYQLHIRTTTPWFEAWRDCFLRIAYSGDHEFLKNYLACIMIVSTSHLDPMDAFAKLVQLQTLQQQQSPGKLPKWFMPNVYKYFLLLHDVTEGEESNIPLRKAVSVFADLKQQYGAGNCHLLQINSKRVNASTSQTGDDSEAVTNMTDPWRLYVKQSSSSQQQQQTTQVVSRKEGSMSDSLSNLTDLIDHELNLNASIAHPLNSLDTSSSSDINSMTTDDGYAGSSTTSTTTVIHGACLTLSDHDRIHVFMNEFVTKGLLPWVETNLKTFNEQITSRRGLTKFFTMPKKLFGGSSTAPAKHTPSPSPTNLPADSIEIVLRRAGDLAFLFQNYENAYANYYAAKRDLSREQAPTFYAGVLEMCALANFMQESSATKPYPIQYMDEAIDIYAISGRLPIFATRCVLLSTEILKSKDAYDQAVQQFLKLSHDDSDLRGALFLEQASHCFLNYRPPFVRKYAFHLVIAGHRYLKAGQRFHALRCYNNVLNIYKNPNWSLALDHINFTLGKQSSLLNNINDTITSFNALFAANNRMQTAQQQIMFFKEYLTIFNQLANSQILLPELPVPIIDNTTIKVLLAGFQQPRMGGYVSNCNDFDFDETRDVWSALERTITAHDRRHSGTRAQYSLFTNRTHNQQHPIAVANETVRLEFSVRNPLQVPLLLSEVQILWRYTLTVGRRKTSISTENMDESKEYTNDTLVKQIDPPVESDVLADSVIFPNDTSKIHLSLRPRRPGFVTILGICYRLNILVQNTSDQTSWPYGIMGKTLFHVKGARLNSNRKERLNVMYGIDKRMELQVVPEAPLLHVEFSPMPPAMFCGEIQSCLVHLFNSSSTHPINRVRLATSQPDLIAVSSMDDDCLLTYVKDAQSTWNESRPLTRQSPILTLVHHQHPLTANSTQTFRLWLRASHLAGEMNIDFVFVYESDVFQQPLRYRTVKHSSLFITTHSLGLTTQPQSIGLGELLLPVQIDNLMATPNTLRINVQQLSCISQKYNIHSLSAISNNTISYGENLSLLFKCTTKTNEQDIPQITHIHLANDPSSKNKYVDISRSPIGDFYRNSISTATIVPAVHRQKVSTPLALSPLSLVLLWQIAMPNQLGQIEVRHGVHILSPPSIEFLSTTQPTTTDAIHYELIYPPVIEHSFSTNSKILFLPIQLKLFNRSHEQVRIQLQLQRTSLGTDPLLSSCCLWCGLTEQSVDVPPLQHVFLSLRACFFKPGFYSLGNMSLAIVDKTNIATPITSNMAHTYFVDIRTAS